MGSASAAEIEESVNGFLELVADMAKLRMTLSDASKWMREDQPSYYKEAGLKT